MTLKTVGSICSGIEAASVSWMPLGLQFQWFSEIEEFPSQILADKYPNIPNLGDMNNIPKMLANQEISSPDILCAGTPCQAFSLAGWKNGLEDDRGNLTLKFVDIVEKNDKIRKKKNQAPSIVFWENVEGVLKDRTNAFGCLLSSLAGLDEVLPQRKWPNAGYIKGPKRNIAWRVLDAKYFGVPQQRKRVYLLAGGKSFHPEKILFEENSGTLSEFNKNPLEFQKDGIQYELFREYTDCLYSSYGTKWNGNAAAYNGSLFVTQDNRIRRFSPLECERLMGFPDHYTSLDGKAKRTPRYQALGNSWAVPVITWIGKRLLNLDPHQQPNIDFNKFLPTEDNNNYQYFDFTDGKNQLYNCKVNFSEKPEKVIQSNLTNIVDPTPPKSIYISPVGCNGIVRRKNERKLNMNIRLEEILINIANEMSPEDIERISRRQKRGRFSTKAEEASTTLKSVEQMSLF